MRPDESACGSKTSPDWLKLGPSVLRCAMIGPLTNVLRSYGDVHETSVMHKRVMNDLIFPPFREKSV